jgi:putative nucleotidyltransferase with HDIG domain
MIRVWNQFRATALQPLSRLRQWPLVLFGLVLAILLTIILTLRFGINQDVEIGKPSPRTINAPRDLTFESPILTEAKRREAANDPRNLVYVEDDLIHAQQRRALQETFNVITTIRNNPSLSVDERRSQIAELPTEPISATLATKLAQFSDEEWQRVINQSNALYDRTLQDHNYSIDADLLETIKTRYLPYNIAANLSDDQRIVVLYFVDHTLEANRALNQEETQRRQNAARSAVASVTKTVVAGENVVRQGDLVTVEQDETLRKLGLITPSLGLEGLLARTLLAALVALALSMYIYLYQPLLRVHQRALLVVLGLVVTPILIARVFTGTWVNFPETFALALIALPLAALFDGSLALVAVALIALVVSFIGDNAFQLGMLGFAGATAGVLAIRRGERASTFVVAGSWIIAVVFCTGLVWRLMQPNITWKAVLFTLLFSIINGCVSALMAFGINNILGRAAGIVTPMQLLELAHPNQPLLRRLMQEAPGTYHHSVVVSNLAEQAAERIGADPLLTRVGAYYHDVGKMLRPYFFTDNQYDRSNVHDSLDPKTSAKLIADHVVEGAKTARKYNLPPQIIAFILQHHGTDVIRYFYQQALQSEDSANLADYCYPGPKPQSKETAILMLADGVEATVRSREQSGQLIAERDNDQEKLPKGGQTIAQVVNQSIDSRISSGQLDESPLTLRDLETIRTSFVKTLQGIYHPRVEYPKLTRDMQEK